MTKQSKQAGFTMVEVMVVMAVLAILATFAVPSFLSWRPNFHLKGASRDLLSNFQKAKVQAVKNRSNCVVAFNGAGYQVFLDDQIENFALDTVEGETILTQVNWAEDYNDSLTSVSDNFEDDGDANNPIAFQPRALPEKTDTSIGGGTVTLTNVNEKKLYVIISDTGVIRISDEAP